MSQIIHTGVADPTVARVLQPPLAVIGTIAFAVSGALLAARKHMDLVGVVGLGCVVSVGGGTARDIILGSQPVFWVEDPSYLALATIAALAAIPLHRSGTLAAHRRLNAILVSDAIGTAVFAVASTGVALEADAAPMSAALVGVIGGIGGGVVRDLLATEIPDVFRNGELAATSAFGGSLAFVAMQDTALPTGSIVWLSILIAVVLRVTSVMMGWAVPRIPLERPAAVPNANACSMTDGSADGAEFEPNPDRQRNEP